MRNTPVLSLQLLGVAAWIAVAPVASLANDEKGVDPSIEGTWVSKIIVSVNPPAAVYSLSTFFAGGQAIEDTSASMIRSVGQGEWVRLGDREFMRTIYIFQFAPPHVFSGVTKVTNHFELNHVGDEFDSVGIFENYDTNGNLVSTGQRASHGKRCTVTTTVPQCMGFAN